MHSIEVRDRCTYQADGRGVKQQTEHIGEFSFVFPRSITKGVCAGQRGVVVSVLRPQPDAGGAGAAFEPSVGSGSLREGKAGSGGNSQKV